MEEALDICILANSVETVTAARSHYDVKKGLQLGNSLENPEPVVKETFSLVCSSRC